jgi:uncharacterized protein (TIGR02145 family)
MNLKMIVNFAALFITGVFFYACSEGGSPSSAGNVDTDSCPASIPADSFCDMRDGQIYKTVKIGSKTWMAENLNFLPSDNNLYYRDGFISWCYDDQESNCAIYGRLYDWSTAGRVCPEGWYLPGQKELGELKDLVEFVNDNYVDLGDFGFNVSGCLHSEYGGFQDEGYRGYWWIRNNEVSFWTISSYMGKLVSGPLSFSGERLLDGRSVRCVLDDRLQVNSSSSFKIVSSSSSIINEPSCPASIPADSFCDMRDGQTYKTVKIGSQTWMAENLNYFPGYQAGNTIGFNILGVEGFYDRRAAMSACPSGWHLPSNTEWRDLVEFIGGNDAGGYLKAGGRQSGWGYSYLETTEFTDEYDLSGFLDKYGFSAITRSYPNVYHPAAYWWTATEDSNGFVYYHLMQQISYDELSSKYFVSRIEEMSRGHYGDYFSVRCVLD